MRICMVTYRGLPRGGVVHASYLAEALAALGHEVELYFIWHMARDGEEGRTFYRKLEIPVHAVSYDGGEEEVNIEAVTGMAEALAAEIPPDFDIYHVHDAVGTAAVASVPGRQGKLVWTIHHLDTYNDPELDAYFEAQLPKADSYVTVSDHWLKKLRDMHEFESMVVHNGVDITNYRPGLDVSGWKEELGFTNEPVLLFVGGMEPRKGLEHMLLTLELVQKKVPETKLVVVGSKAVSSVVGESTMAKALMARTKTTDDVRFLSGVDEKEMPALYDLASMVVLPSRNEGWGLSLHQGMACGKPVAAFSVGGVGELVTDDAGVLVPYGDIFGLSNAVVSFLTDPEKARKYGNAGRERAIEYNWNRSAEEAERVYKRALGQ